VGEIMTDYIITESQLDNMMCPRPSKTLYTHYFTCEDCKAQFSIMTVDEHYSNALGTINYMVSCPNSLCKSDHIVMDDVMEEIL
jgi:hypothetical protein